MGSTCVCYWSRRTMILRAGICRLSRMFPCTASFFTTSSTCMQPKNRTPPRIREFLAVAQNPRGATLHHFSHPRPRPRHPPGDMVGIVVPTSTPRRAEQSALFSIPRVKSLLPEWSRFQDDSSTGKPKKDPWGKYESG